MVTSIQKDKYETAERPWQVRFSIVSKLTNFQIPFKNRTLFSPEYLKTFFKWYDFCLVGPYPLKLLFVLFSKTPSSYARLFENEIFLRFGCPEFGSLLYPQSCKSWSNIFFEWFQVCHGDIKMENLMVTRYKFFLWRHYLRRSIWSQSIKWMLPHARFG